MIDTSSRKVQINQIVRSQLPSFVSEENPLFVDFLKQYYISQEYQGGPIDILSNFNQYQKTETFSGNDNLIGFTTCTSSVTSFDTTINVTSTRGWPEKYGLLKIGDEVITYTGITTNSFTGCVRGFSGVDNLHKTNQPDSLVFTSSDADSHISSSRVLNLSNLFLQEFWKKTKEQFLPGFEDRSLVNKVDKANFLRQAKDFYASKGTDEAVKILFNVLFDKRVEVVKPIEFLFAPSDADYVVTNDVVVELISGDPNDVIGQTLYQTDNPSATASIFNVRRYERDGRSYYILSLSRNSITGEFEVTGSSTLVQNVSAGSTVVTVDSTLGFPNTGSVYIGFGQTVGIATYSSKSSTQFFGVTGITSAYPDGQFIRSSRTVFSYENGDVKKPVYFRLTSVISNASFDDIGFLVPNDVIGAKILGNVSAANNYRLNSWIHNIKTKSNVSRNLDTNTSNIDIATNTVTTSTPHLLYLEDSVTLVDVSSAIPSNVEGTVSQVINPNQFKINLNSGSINISKVYKVRKNINFGVSNTSRIKVSDFSTNVQNTYSSLDNKNFYVTSGSIPSYRIYATDRRKTFDPSNVNNSQITINNHGFYSGDLVKYNPVGSGTSVISGLSTGSIYSVLKVDDNTIKLSQSIFDASSKRSISITNVGGASHQIVPADLADNRVQYQNFLREFPVTPELKEIEVPFINENVGMFRNGVEIFSNRSGDSIYYGVIENIDVENGGSGYDVLYPPNINIKDSVGSGATSYAIVENGKFDRIEVISGGYDLKRVPSITITGGNGSGATASARLRAVRTSRTFNADIDVNTTDNRIVFNSNHLFFNGESVYYEKSTSFAPVGGLQDKSIYYVHKVNEKEVQLMNTYDDALLGTNPINLTSKSAGTNTLTTTIYRNILDSIIVDNPGSGYSNRKTVVQPSIYPPADYSTLSDIKSGISTANDYIFFKQHGFKTGDLVEYRTTGNVIGGLSTSQNYYVYRLNDDQFKVVSAGIGTTSTKLNFNNKEFINLTSIGSGSHTFKYPDIHVSVEAVSGIANTVISSPIVRPICTGNITETKLTAVGSGYGVTDTFNVHRRPNVTVSNGSNGAVDVVISDGKIAQAFVKIPGGGYVTPPILSVSGDGKYAKLVATVSNGSLTGVTIVDPGSGYSQEKTTVSVTPSGNGAKFRADVRKWEVDFVQKYRKSISENDDGVILPSQNENYGNKYSHVYLSRKLRLILGDNIENDFSEKTTLVHSPIVGWAYDGCPIYGPYGFDAPNGGTVRRLRPGYTLSSKGNRPSTDTFPSGFFINDWDYINNGDLDEYNGRFCKTPEFPDGVYAYFCTISATNSSSSPFTNTREPLFPYVLNGYKHKKNIFNELPTSIQNLPILNSGNLIRNTYPYKFGFSDSEYDYLVRNNLKDTEIVVRSVVKTGISTVNVIVPGKNYRVNERVIFNNSGSGGSGASAKVKTLVGKGISEISYAETVIDNISFSYENGKVVGVATTAHGITNHDLIVVSGIGTGELKFIEGARTVAVSSVTNRLDVGIGTSGATGIVTTLTFASASNDIFVDDILIDSLQREKFKVLSVDKTNNNYRVLRQSGIITSHDAGQIFFIDQSRFSFDVGVKTSLSVTPNKKIVFNPQASIGIGTTTVVQTVAGIGTTTVIRVISNDGTILADHQLPPSGSTADNSISITNHGLKSGDRLVYTRGQVGVALTVSNNLDLSGSFNLVDGQTLFAVNKGKDLLGITTTKTGIGTTSTSLYFLPVQTRNGLEHTFTTQNKEYVGHVRRYDVSIKVVDDHTLNDYDKVTVHIHPNTTETKSIEYNSAARKTIVDPKYFGTANVGVGNSLSRITIVNHGFNGGDKVVYTATTPITPLVNNGEYYIQKISDDIFRLSSNYYDATKFGGSFIGISSFGSGTHKLAKINPHITVTRGQTVGFAVSDGSLQNLKLEFYEDESFENRYEGFGISTEVTRSGTPGVAGAVVNLKLSENVPSPLYYRLTPTNLNAIDVSKRDATPDKEVVNGSKIIIENSVYAGTHSISTVTSTEFRYQTSKKPEYTPYTSNSGVTSFRYVTDSTVALGGINEIDVNFGGVNYVRNPGIGTINTAKGRDVILRLYDSSIGRPGSREITKIGYDYPSDKSVKPSVDIPTVATVTNNFVLSQVGVITAGRNYITAPDLFIPDNPEVQLRANLEGTSVGSVDVLVVGRGFNEVPNPPRIVAIRNTNGVGIVSASSNGPTNFLTLTQPINGWRSDGTDFPFKVGDPIFVEGIGIQSPSTSTGGYNSSDYDYSFFTVASRNPSASQITYSIAGIGTSGGTYDPDNSAGRVIRQADLPTFIAKLTPEPFFAGERVTYGSNGTAFVLGVNGYNPVTNTLRLEKLTTRLRVGDVIKGFLSGAEGTVANVQDYTTFFETNFTTVKPQGWQKDTGKLSENFQKLSDNDYYQNFSYSVKSEVQENQWKDAVDSVIHPAGYKNFSDLIVNSKSTAGFARSSTLRPGQATADTSISVNIDNVKSFYVKDDFDYAAEEVIASGDSKFITLDNKRITSFINVKTNKVNIIDNISNQFTGIGTTTSAKLVGLTSFRLKTDNGLTVLFNKVFDGSSASIVSVGSSIIRINNHNFQTGEKIKYDPGNSVYGNNRIGITSTNKVVGGITTNFLPAEIYVIKIDNNQFSLAGLNTAVDNNEPFTLRSLGTGTNHSFDTIRPDNRVIIDLDGIIQSPLYKKNVDVTLAEAVGVGSTTIKVVGVTSITTNDLLNIDNEILRINVVGFGSTNVLTVDRGVLGSVAAAHTVGAAVTMRAGDFTINKDVIYFIDPPYGPVGVSTLRPGISTQTSFAGRVFNRNDPTTNFIFDDVSDKFTGIGKTFTLLQDDQNVSGIVTTKIGGGEVTNYGVILINNIFQRPTVDYTMTERTDPGIGGSIFFSGSTRTNLPRGGIIERVAVGFGSGYQNIVAAAATAIINGAGAIESVVVTGGGSGYRNGPVDIEVYNPLGIGSTAVLSATVGAAGTITGISTVSGGSGYASTNPPLIVVGIPTGYTNMSFTGGQGSGLRANIVVGTGGSIIDYDITDGGLGYANGDVLTVAGIPTDPSVGAGFSAFTFTVDGIINDKFSGYSFGQLLELDSFADQFDGNQTTFTLTRTTTSKQVINIDSLDTSIDVQNNLLVFLNDILQRPGQNYTFEGGTQITFTEAPKAGSKLQILFFRGSNTDVDSGEPFLTVKVGDKLTLQRRDYYPLQLGRRVTEITGVSKVETNLYGGVGINTDASFTRMVSWERQTNDLILNNQALSKARDRYIAKVDPTTNIIQNVGVNSSQIYVKNAFPFFSAYDNRATPNEVPSVGVKVITENIVDRGDGSATVSAGGTIASVSVTDPGAGYLTVPTVSFASTVTQIKEIGRTWIAATSGTNIEYETISFSPFGIFFAAGDTGINSSPNGVDWTDSGVTGFGAFKGVVGLSTNVIAVGVAGTVAVSTNYGGTFNASTIYSRKLLAGAFIYQYTDTTISQDINDIVASSNKLVAVGAAGTILFSIDGPSGFGTSFIISQKYSSQNLRGVGNQGSTYVAVGDNGTILRSINGENWTGVTTTSISTRLNDVAYGDGKWVAVGAAGTIIRSTDNGLTWSVVSSGSTFNLNSVFYQNNVWVAVGQTGNALNSINGANWNKKLVGVTTDFNDLAFGNNKLITVGLSSNIRYSEFATVSAAGTATVSAAGTITSINLSDGGFGYDPNYPVEVLVSIEPVTIEVITSVKCEGDYGTIVGLGTSATGIGTNSPMVIFELDSDQFLDQAGFGNIVRSGLGAGDYFVVSNSVIGSGLTTINKGGSVIGIGTSFIDNIYRAEQVVISNSGIVTVYCNVQSLAGLAATSPSYRIGDYSWGRFYDFSRDRVNPRSFTINNQNGYTGLSSAPLVIRYTGLSENYSNFDQTS